MCKKQKLIDKLKTRSKNFTYDEAESLLLSLGFKKSNKGKTSGSRVKFSLGKTYIRFHKPHPQKELKPYVVNDILEVLESEELI